MKLIWKQDGTSSLGVSSEQHDMLKVMKTMFPPETIVVVAGKRIRLELIALEKPEELA